MESVVGIATGRGGSLQMPSSAAAASISSFAQSARKEWQTISDHHLVRNITDEELERMNLGQSDERTIYEQRAETLHVDFSSITIDGNLDNHILQQRLHNVCRQREDLEHLEVELRAQFIARSGIMQMQNSFEAQIKDHANAAEHLKGQLQEKEHIIYELEIKMEEKNRELCAIKIDNETAWAKEDLLMEQNKELANYRRELDNTQAERVHTQNQVHELEEYIQNKERQILELKEQHRVAQETILYKDEQLREAQAWVAHAQEMDALQLTTNHSLQIELRDRTEQFNQFWLGYQRQFVDMERHHMQAIQQLQLQLAEARERGGLLTEQSSHTAHGHSEDTSPFRQNMGNLFNNADVMLKDNSEVLTNGDEGNVSALVSTENTSSETDHLSGAPVGAPSLLGVGTNLPPGQMTAMHHFVMHPQGVAHTVPSVNLHVAQSNMDNFQPMPAISFHQHRQSHQQAVSEDSQESNQIQYQPSPAQELLRSGAHRDHELAINGQVLYKSYVNSHVTPGQEVAVVTLQVLESKDKSCLITQQEDQIIQGTTSKFDGALGLDSLGRYSETKERDEQMVNVTNHLQESQSLATEQPPANRVALSDTSIDQASSREAIDRNGSGKQTEASILLRSTSNLLTPEKTPEASLLDERSLLVCIVRAIPAGSVGRVRISSTLPNRLGKMLAPLHWHDYKKKYGKLDDFVANHPELFVIEGDYIQLREGAQEIISATAAVAKVAAAASVPYLSSFPSVAVTPMAQSHRLKKVPSNGSKSVTVCANGPALSTHADTGGKSSQPSSLKNQHSNDVCSDIVQGFSNVKILSKSKDPLPLNGLQSRIRSGHSSMHMAVGNGIVPGLSTSLSKASINRRHGTNFGGKPQERVAESNLISRR